MKLIQHAFPVLLLVSLGCSSNAAPTPASSAPVASHTDPVLAAYEATRDALAHDDMAAAVASAATIESASTAAVGGNDATAPQLRQIASAASKLKTMPTDKPDEVRRAFGAVSEAIVALLTAHPAMRAGHHVFECPMAQGYKKWVQTDHHHVANPYMGSAMLECGSKTDW